MKYEIFVPYIYWKSAGTVEALTEEEALEKAWDELGIEDQDPLCWQCEEETTDHPHLDYQTGLIAECLGAE